MNTNWRLIQIAFFSCLFSVAFSNFGPANPLFGQGDAKADQGKKNSNKKEDELPEPETISLTTKDGVALSVNYYASTKGKKAPPILLIHDWGGSSRDFTGEGGIAEFLQKNGFAVIAPDLRGHGKSTRLAVGDKELDYKKFKKSDFAQMMEDVETCKRYLMKRNNEGKLNIELLSILAIGKTAVIAFEWSIRDWSFPPNNGVKQGQDVKSIILFSPEKSWKGLSLTKSLKMPVISGKSGSALPLFILTGNGDASLQRQTKEIEKALERTRGEKLADETMHVTIGKTKLQGADFAESERGQDLVLQFVKLQILSKQADLRWQNRAKQ